MKKIGLIIALTLSSSMLSNSSYAKYGQDYNEANSTLVKFRMLSVFADGKQSKAPPATSALGTARPNKPGKLFSESYGFDASAAMFINDNFAGEFNLAWHRLQLKKTALAQTAYNYKDYYTIPLKSQKIDTLPLSFTLQYHVAPYGGIRPYVGAGYHYTYYKAKGNTLTFNNTSGPVLQVGMDFVLMDDTYVNLEFKQMMAKTTAKYKKSFISGANDSEVKTKVTVNPMTIGLGLGFRL